MVRITAGLLLHAVFLSICVNKRDPGNTRKEQLCAMSLVVLENAVLIRKDLPMIFRLTLTVDGAIRLETLLDDNAFGVTTAFIAATSRYTQRLKARANYDAN